MNNIATNVRDAVPEDAQALSRYAVVSGEALRR
jgi:hypothetical protein